MKRLAALAAVTVLIGLAGCGGTGAERNADGTATFTVALNEPDIATVPILAAVDTLRQAGHRVRTIELAAPELAIEGLARGDYAISAEATSPALIAIAQGGPIKIIADVIGNQWALYGRSGIASCDDLAGRQVGIFSEGAVATAMTKQWVGAKCGGGKNPNYLTIGDSQVRAQALLARQIDATPLELADVVALESATGPKPVQVANFAETMPGLHPQTVYANAKFLAEYKDVAQAFVTALVAEHAKITADPGHLVRLVTKYLPDEDHGDLAKVAKRYADAKLFDAAALTEQSVQNTIDFFAKAGVVKPGLTARTAADLSFVEAAR